MRLQPEPDCFTEVWKDLRVETRGGLADLQPFARAIGRHPETVKRWGRTGLMQVFKVGGRWKVRVNSYRREAAPPTFEALEIPEA